MRGGLLHSDLFKTIISLENLLAAWQEFKRGKSKKPDVQEFYSTLEENLFELHASLKNKTYQHGGYQHFKISDPKPRDIHKASVRDRLLHHAIYCRLYPHFDTTFIHDSYSCRVEKGTHRAMNRFRDFARKESLNHTRTVWVLKCDIKKFFASINHEILLEILKKYIQDQDTLWLLTEVITSFPARSNLAGVGVGLPLGNLTSQLLVNIYMNEFDQYVKHILKARYYIRYADDFVILSHHKPYLQAVLSYMEVFLQDRLNLTLHPNKVFIKTSASGIDLLGWVHFEDHRLLRTSTKRRMVKRIKESIGQEGEEATRQSYLGLLRHGNGRRLREQILSF